MTKISPVKFGSTYASSYNKGYIKLGTVCIGAAILLSGCAHNFSSPNTQQFALSCRPVDQGEDVNGSIGRAVVDESAASLSEEDRLACEAYLAKLRNLEQRDVWRDQDQSYRYPYGYGYNSGYNSGYNYGYNYGYNRYDYGYGSNFGFSYNYSPYAYPYFGGYGIRSYGVGRNRNFRHR